MLSPADYFDLQRASQAALFAGLDLVWEALDRIKPFLEEVIKPNLAPLKARYPDFVPRTVVLHQGRLFEDGFSLSPGDATKGRFRVSLEGREVQDAVVIYGGACLVDERIELSPGVVVESGALIKGPCLIGPRTEVRQGAYLRGGVLVGQGCVVGHATEVKNAVFLDGAKAGHFAYVGDSILGLEVNLGAGTKLANLKIKPGPITLRLGRETLQIQRRKIGAVIGDGCELGCNSVTNPGCLLGPGCLAAPNSSLPAGLHRRRTVFRPRR